MPGLVGFSILTSPMFRRVDISAEYKKSMFRQLTLTPLTRSEWLVSKILWHMLLSAASFVIMANLGAAVLHATIHLTLMVVPFILIGPVLFVSLGMLTGTLAKTQESAGVLANIITFPMMFLSGTFFPLSIMPQYLQTVAQIFPLYYLIQGPNDLMVYSNVVQALKDLVVVCVILPVVFVAAVRVFRWREE